MESRRTNDRRTPRRLFSLDSMKSSSTRQPSTESAEGGERASKKHGKGHAKFATLDQVDEHLNESVLSLNDISESPLSLTPKPSMASLASSAAVYRLPLPALTTNVTVRSMTPDSQPPPSPSAARWNSIRQHVMPSSRSTGHSQQTSSNSLSSISTQQPRHGHPKSSSSKIAQKLGFRNVVEHVRQVVVDGTQQFASELQRACNAAKYVDPHLGGSKSKLDVTQTAMGSTLYLPFMSSTSLATTGNEMAKKGGDMRRQSTHSLLSSNRALGSVKPLYHTLLNYAGPFTDGSQPLPQLPIEQLVMSTLLGPFLTVEKLPRLEEERWTAMEAFEVIVRTWNPVDEITAVERSLWCVQAALCSSPPLRTRTLSALWSLTVSSETRYPATTPRTLQTLLHGLFFLLPAAREQVAHDADTEDSRLLSEIVSHVYAGSGGDLDDLAVEEEYNALFVDGDSSQKIRDAVTIEALARCLEYSTEETKRWLLTNSLENLWSLSPYDLNFTPLQTAIHSRALNSFTRAALALISPSSSASSSTESKSDLRRYNDGVLIVRALQSRVFPSIDSISNIGATEEARKNVVAIALELASLQGPVDTGTGAGELVGWAVEVICRWLKGEKPEWKASFEKAFRHLVEASPWAKILNIVLPLILLLPRDIQKLAVMLLIPLLNDRLVNDPPPTTSSSLSNSLQMLFTTLSQQYPQLFFKPLFLLAASSKEFAIIDYLCVLTALEKVIPGFLVRDAEMVAVAVMSGGGTQGKDRDSAREWGKARLGQLVLLVELIARIQDMRRVRESTGLSSNVSDGDFVQTAKFAVELEARLTILIDAKERTSLVPPSQRLLFAVLFREIRLLTRSLKNATWVPKFVSWFVDYHAHENDVLNESFDLEVMDAVSQIQTLYNTAREGSRPSHKLRNTLVLSPTPGEQSFPQSSSGSPEATNGTGISVTLSRRAPLLEGLAKGFEARVLKLLVAMSAMVPLEDWKRIGSLLWEKHLGDNDPAILSSVCFLVMQCAEKTPMDLLACIQVDLQSVSDTKRLSAILKLSTLVDWRFQIMSQHVVADRAHRPFKVARGPLPFVSTDMGTSSLVLEPDPNEVKDKLPLELRKKLAEIGWDNGDAPVNQQLEWIRTPMLLLPALQIDKLDSNDNSPLPSPNLIPISSPQQSSSSLGGEKAEELALLRRNSSSGGPSAGLKRRAVFVPSLTRILPDVSRLAFDESFAVADAARNLIIDLMRNDPGLLTRPVWDLLEGDEEDLKTAVTSLRAFLHVRRVLPPAVAHNMLNNLAGFLKFMAKQSDGDNAFHKYARVIPVIAKLVTQVSNMSIREMKRAKVDMFFIPSGSLWFPSSAPVGPMFPRNAGNLNNPFISIDADDFPDRIVSITMVRISQNMLFLAMLKRNPADVQVVRKSMTRLVLPSWNPTAEALPLELKDFVPVKQSSGTSVVRAADLKLRGLSLLLSRSYLLLIAQVFRSMSRHLNDRNELAILIDGIVLVLLAHGSDIGIVAQALIALMVASTRFRRLFASGGGYALFMPALFKVYAESEAHSGIRKAIEYATNRFYAHHQETFVFQSLDAITYVLLLREVDGAWVGRNVYTLFASLRRGASPCGPDAAGIYDANKYQEREALIILTAEEKPQTFLESLRQTGSHGQNGKVHVTVDLPDEYETQHLSIDDFVRLSLTVIAHDLSIARAEQFLKLLRYLTPSLYEASQSARSVLQEGIVALGVILSRPTPKAKASEASRSDDGHGGQDIISLIGKQLAAPGDMTAMRIDYLWLVASFTQAGGKLPPEVSRVTFDLVKTVLRESSSAVQDSVASFLGAYTKASLLREESRSLKAVVYFLRDLAPVVSAYALTIDFSDVFETIRQLVRNPMYSRDSTFCYLVVNQICAAGLNACDLGASEKLLHTLSFRGALVSLMKDAVFLREVDIFAELQSHKQHYDFLALIVLPLALTMRTASELDSEGIALEPSLRDVQTKAWIRLLHYAMSCCHKSRETRDGSPTPVRNRSRDRRSSEAGYKSHLPSLIIALQVIKVIIIRAAKDLTSSYPDVWSRLGVFLKSILAEGGGDFALRGTQDYSPSPSPTPSPRASGQFDMSFPSSLPLNFGVRSYISPRIVDYCLWSMAELLCVHRNPLFIQLRAFMHEKVRILDQGLRYQQNLSTTPGSRSRRPSSSIFTKRRRRFSDVSSIPSPEASPSLAATQARESGYLTISHPSPHESPSPQGPGPRIVHLGLVSNSNTPFQRSTSPAGSSEMRFMAKSTKVRSLVLIRKTYLRIRAVQCSMGYDSCLLPLPQSSMDRESADGTAQVVDEDAPSVIAWTKRQALMEVTSETRDLMEEFEEVLGGLDGSPVIVDATSDQ